MFVVVEGFDGTGKSSLTEILKNKEFTSIKTPLSERAYARELFDSKSQTLTRFLYYLGEVIEASNFIKKNSSLNIVCDRYIYSTIAYHMPLLPNEVIRNSLDAFKDFIIKPDLIVYLTCPEEILFSRIKQREKIDYNRELNESYLHKVLNAYKSLITNNWLIIDSSKTSIEDEAGMLYERLNSLNHSVQQN